MLLTIFNRATAQGYSISPDGGQIVIGRSPSAQFSESMTTPGVLHVRLPSRTISRAQLLLRRTPKGLLVENTGVAPVFKAKDPVPNGQPVLLTPEEHLDFGEFTLTIAEAPEAAVATEVIDDRAALDRMEREIHAQLLERMDARRTGQALDLNKPEHRERVQTELAALCAARLPTIADDALARLARLAIFNRVLYNLTAFGRDARRLEAVSLMEQRHAMIFGQLEEVARDIAQALKIMTEAGRFAQDLAALEANYESVVGQWIGRFAPAVLRELVALQIQRDLLNLVFGLGPLQELMEMDALSEVMVVSRAQIFVEKFGVIEDSRRSFISDDSVLTTIDRIVAPLGRRIDKSTPLVDARLADGSRVNAVVPPLAIRGACLTIRKFARHAITLQRLVEIGALSAGMAAFLEGCVKGRLNIVVSGGTGSGKTTLLNCLSSFIGERERVITIEDTAELRLQQAHVVSLEARPANMEGKGEITIRHLVKNALRMRPDRIVVGECRGAEALDMLQAMNTGHDGSMTTAHANSPQDMIGRLETMVLSGTEMPVSAIRDQIASAVDLIVQLTRFSDGARRVSHVSEIIGVDDKTGRIVAEEIFRTYWDADGGEWRTVQTGYVPTFASRLVERGLLTVESLA